MIRFDARVALVASIIAACSSSAMHSPDAMVDAPPPPCGLGVAPLRPDGCTPDGLSAFGFGPGTWTFTGIDRATAASGSATFTLTFADAGPGCATVIESGVDAYPDIPVPGTNWAVDSTSAQWVDAATAHVSSPQIASSWLLCIRAGSADAMATPYYFDPENGRWMPEQWAFRGTFSR